jgi:hypothetical protein
MRSVMPFKADEIPVLDGLTCCCAHVHYIERGMGKLIACPHGNGAGLDAAPASLERFSLSKV